MKNRATECKWIRNSNSNPDYHKYEVTYLDSKGVSKKVPAYGRDMQEALKRVNKTLNKEKNKKLLEVILVFTIIILVTSVSLLIHQFLN